MPHELGLAERRRHVELAVEADARRDLLEQLVDRRDADRGEHLRAVGVGQAQVAHPLLLGDVRAVRLGVHQRVDLGRVGHADPDEPALAVRVVVHGLGLVDDLLR